jgi:hypothetical protein
MKKILTTISLLLFVTIAVALEYKPGKKIPAKEGVVGLLLAFCFLFSSLILSISSFTIFSSVLRVSKNFSFLSSKYASILLSLSSLLSLLSLSSFGSNPICSLKSPSLFSYSS